MSYNVFEFVNREKELKIFIGMLGHRQSRILSLQGKAGIGKSCLLHHLRNECKNRDINHVFIDFQSKPSLTESSQLIRLMREQIGNTFSERLAAFEEEVQQNSSYNFSLSSEMQDQIVPTIALNLSNRLGNHLSLSGEIQVGGDVVGGDKIIINKPSIIVNPDRDRDSSYAELETRRNEAFQSALIHLLRTEQVVLFFDHVDKAVESITYWIRHQLLRLHLEGQDECENLWIVMAGRGEMPFQEELEQWRHLFRSHELHPLHEDAIQSFWVEKRGLDSSHLRTILPTCGGNPQLLFVMANNLEMALESQC